MELPDNQIVKDIGFFVIFAFILVYGISESRKQRKRFKDFMESLKKEKQEEAKRSAF